MFELRWNDRTQAVAALVTISFVVVMAAACEQSTETVYVDAACLPQSSGHDGGAEADLSDGGVEDDADEGASLGNACDSDEACASGECLTEAEQAVCTESCTRGENPCGAELECLNQTCVPKFYCEDDDEDGYGSGPGCKATDCDDTSGRVHAGAEERCGNDVDDDCDGETDEGTRRRFYRDRDGDGWGTDRDVLTRVTCWPPEGFVPRLGDCNDDNETINPEAEERCDTERDTDEDCDGEYDENC